MTSTEPMTKAAKKSKITNPTFRKGDCVRVTDAAMTPECWGQACTVRRVFWAQAGGGQTAGWACEVDIPFGPNQYRKFWQNLLTAVNHE